MKLLFFSLPILGLALNINGVALAQKPSPNLPHIQEITFTPIKGISFYRLKIPFKFNCKDRPPMIGDTPIFIRSVDTERTTIIYQDLNQNFQMDADEPQGEFGKELCLKYKKNNKDYSYWMNLEYFLNEKQLVVSSATLFESEFNGNKIRIADVNIDGIFGKDDFYELNSNGNWMPLENKLLIKDQLYYISTNPNNYKWKLTTDGTPLSSLKLISPKENVQAFFTIKNEKLGITTRIGTHSAVSLPAGEYKITQAQFHIKNDKEEISFAHGNHHSTQPIIVKKNDHIEFDFKIPTQINFNLTKNKNGGYNVSHPVLVGSFGETYLPLILGSSFSNRMAYCPKVYLVKKDKSEEHLFNLSYG